MQKDMKSWSQEDKNRIKAYYEDTQPKSFSLAALARSIGRTYAAVALKASRMGFGKRCRLKPRQPTYKQMSLPWSKWVKFPHPRGMLGKNHSPEVKAAFGEAVRKKWVEAKANGTGYMSPSLRKSRSDRAAIRSVLWIKSSGNCYSRAKRGKRPDLGDTHFRSGWEANYARYLNFQVKNGWIRKWEYEPETFWFLTIKRGVRSYTPDFKVWPCDGGEPYFDEVKGWLDNKSKTKLKRMKKYYPKVVINLVDEKRYKGIAQTAGALIPTWE